MNRSLAAAAVAVLVVTAAALAPAAASGPSSESPGPRASRTRPVSPSAELLAIVEAEREPIAALRGRIVATRDPARALELQRRIEAIKRDTALGLLRAQAERARREGRSEVAARLDRAARALVAEPPARRPGAPPATPAED